MCMTQMCAQWNAVAIYLMMYVYIWGGLVCFELLSHAQGACFLFNLSSVIFSEGGCVRERLTTHHILNAITLEPL